MNDKFVIIHGVEELVDAARKLAAVRELLVTARDRPDITSAYDTVLNALDLLDGEATP